MRTFTLTELLTAVRQRADMENSTFVTDAEVTFFLNSSLAELHDILINRFEDYSLTSRMITLNSQQSFYPLPEDFLKLRLAEASVDSSFTQRRTLTKFQIGEANQVADFFVNNGAPFFLYRLSSDTLQLIPEPTATAYVRLWYYQGSKKLDGTVRTFLDANVSVANDTITYTAHGYSVGDRISFTTTGVLPTGLTASTDYYTVPTSKSAFKVATTVDRAFKNLTVDITAAAGGGTHTINDDSALYDGKNGWEEYAVVDAAMKCLEKEESDTSALDKRKTMLYNRIVSAAAKRDASQPERISDVALRNSGRGWVMP